ncbi:hypothetical protein ACFFHM_03385 [Halalkalibacter kiskunsagensis]|uniref:Tricorn protease C1 domain-containing protein n=1 Tax=Halalkalibacter kiskunsagensis TaxID=1548599 RepID=A0ABV6K8F5_9BACI
MKKWIVGFGLISVLLTGCHQQEIDENAVLSFYDEFFTQVHELFAYHMLDDEGYFNKRYHTDESIRLLLEEFMTDEGMINLLNELYVENDGKYFYKDQFQSFLRESEASYYEVTRKTVFNPGVRMIVSEDLHIHESATGEIVIVADNVPVQFYSEDSSYGQSQFGKLGYPPIDHVSLTVSIVKEKENYRINNVEVQS